MNIVGIDIGGTTIKADLYRSDGRSLNEFREVTTEIDFEKKTNQILEQVCQLIAFYKEKFELDGVAISSAGVVDSQSGKSVTLAIPFQAILGRISVVGF